MKPVKLNFKKLSPEAVTPKYSKSGDCGADLTATSMLETGMYIEYGTSLAVEIPPGYVGLIYPRSSCSNYALILSNCVGVVDPGYTGEIRFRFKKSNPYPFADHRVYAIGDRIGQLIVQQVPRMLFNEVEELEQSERGSLGFGSSGV